MSQAGVPPGGGGAAGTGGRGAVCRQHGAQTGVSTPTSRPPGRRGHGSVPDRQLGPVNSEGTSGLVSGGPPVPEVNTAPSWCLLPGDVLWPPGPCCTWRSVWTAGLVLGAPLGVQHVASEGTPSRLACPPCPPGGPPPRLGAPCFDLWKNGQCAFSACAHMPHACAGARAGRRPGAHEDMYAADFQQPVSSTPDSDRPQQCEAP